jgi:superfamily II DNA or RNA helicase
MQVITELSDVALIEVEEAVGKTSFQRGRSYARGNRVLELGWDDDERTLTGSVVGQGAMYNTAAFFVEGPDAPEFSEGECTCPIGWNCKHVAAIVVAAAAAGGGGRASPRGTAVAARGTAASASSARALAPNASSWEGPLRALIDAPAPRATGAPLAIEMTLRERGTAGRGALRLSARLLRPGARGGWVNGSLSWNGLDSWHVRNGEYRADHLALARDLRAVCRAGDERLGYSYYHGAEKALDLSDCGTQLWTLLEEAESVGLQLLHAGREPGELPRYRQGAVQLDVTRHAGEGALVRTVLRIDGEGAENLRPALFLGANGHGVVCVEAEASDLGRARLHLVRLARPAAPNLQRMLLDGERLTIPSDELVRFSDEVCPELRHIGEVVSSDGSFTPPEISAPRLVLRADYGADHAVEAGWLWEYRVGDRSRRAPLQADGAPGFRDHAAERAVLADTVLGDAGLARLGLLDGAGRPSPASAVALGGLDSMRLTADELPRLAARTDVTVEIAGEPADYRDVGDSLAIGVSTQDLVDDQDWFALGVSVAVEGNEVPFADVFAALAAGESHLLLPDGAHFSLSEPRLQALRQLIDEARALTDSPTAPLRLSRYQAGLWGELAALGVVTEQAQRWERQVGALLQLDTLVEHEPPATLTANMRPYQRDGFRWLAVLSDLELGGILADDMGLGKTLQALAMICHARERRPDDGPFLVVAPTSVVPNWVAEAARFAPGLRVAAVTDTLARAGRTIDEVATADVVVTTYTLFRLEADDYRTVPWAGLILDEAQFVKNHQSKTYRCVRELAAPFKLAITGTPMENNLMELWALLSICAPGLFPDPKRFSEQYARPIERGGDAEQLARLRRRIKPLVKRRTKELVAADLPAKQEQTLEVELHPRHRKVYDTHLQRERQRILGLLDDFNRNRFTILRSITLLRQLSLHPGLVDKRHDALPCAKLGALVEQLGDITGSGHRALVFSQFTGFLAKARERLDQEGIGYCYLDGRTRRRERVLKRFKEGDDPVFLISLKAGGSGLNLTEADYCFLLDPWWNPAAEAQAIDRTHRIGQTRPVMAYRMIARDTIEERVAALARRKAELFKGVLDEGDLFVGGLTAEDIRGLLG